MFPFRLWLRWSWRDLRARWVQVAAIALVIALGTGTYAGFNSMTAWRLVSNEQSYGVTNMYDLRVRLAEGSTVPAGSLLDALSEIEHASWIRTAEERLILPTQIEAPTADGSVLVPGRIVGVDLEAGGPHVASLHTSAGRALTTEDIGADMGVMEHHFADFYNLDGSLTLALPGGQSIESVGWALAPEYFLVVGDDGSFYAEANFGVLFTSIETAGRLGGVEGAVNDAVLTLTAEANVTLAQRGIEETLSSIGVIVTTASDDPSFRLVNEDVQGDDQFTLVFAIAIFAGAVFAAFNLTTRMVEAQRREIGVAMALGLPARLIAVRPLLVGAQIALLGVIFGLGVGWAIGQAMASFIEGFFPLPVWETPFQPGIFLQTAALGFVIPFVAIVYPVWRAVRVSPVDAIRTGHLAARGGGLAPLIKRIPLPGSSFGQIPFRNLLRAPRRVILTLLGIATVITVLVAIVGMVDSMLATFERGDRELLGDTPDRLAISMAGFYPISSPQADEVMGSGALADARAGLSLGGSLINGDSQLDVLLDLHDFDDGGWRPGIINGNLGAGAPGVIIAEKAADDLGVKPGDTIVLRHPVLTGPTSLGFAETEVPVLAVHAVPFRSNVYMHLASSDLMGLSGVTNVVHAVPAAGFTVEDVKRELFALPSVASVKELAAGARLIRDIMEQALGLLQVMEGAILLLALLIAFNSASINMDERAREHATMFAFGVRLRTVMRMAVVESLLLGIAATIVGVIGGYVMLTWAVESLLNNTAPDLGITQTISLSSMALVLILGVFAVAVAPLLTVRKLRRMDIPSTLRVQE